MKKRTRILLTGILAVVFVCSMALVLRQARDNSSAGSTYDEAAAIARSEKTAAQSPVRSQPAQLQISQSGEKSYWIPEPVEEDAHMQALAEQNLDALREVNPDVLGWIRIPDTKIDYPLLQGEDNDFYLGHTWQGEENSVGSVFLEYRNDPSFTDFNTIVYAHNMNDGSMFAALRRYNSPWFREHHPYIYIRTDAGVFRYEVFSAYQAQVDSSTYGLSFRQAQTRVGFLVDALKNSMVGTDIEPAVTDRILTLSTCSGAGYSNRWVVHGRLKMIQTEP